MDQSLKLDYWEEKVLGCLLGGAIGNAMGSLVENWTYERIERTYGTIDAPLDLRRINEEDDYQMALLFCEAYLERGRHVTPEEFARTWLEKFDPGKNFFWCMRNALELLKRGASPRQTGLYNVNTGSALMAIAPVGIYNALEPDRAFSDALDLAYVYQPEPDATCAACFAAGVAVALDPTATVGEVVDAIVERAPSERTMYWDGVRPLPSLRASLEAAREIAGEFSGDWRGARENIYQKLLAWHPIDPVEVLSIATCLFEVTGGEYEEGCVAGTNVGRDADTIANLIGSLCGCLGGVGAIPPEWREGVKEVNPDLYDRFIATARGFARLLVRKGRLYEEIGRSITSAGRESSRTRKRER
ncbi:MAG: hypothetical protein Kow0069_21740 [Promethearchaeota archaeon]